MTEQRDFKGVWIDKEIWLDRRLNALEKVILTEIDSLSSEEKGCYAGNQYLAEFCQCSETKVSLGIKKLIELGYIYQESFDGRVRVLKSRLSNFERQTYKKCKADSQKMKDNNKDNNKEYNIYSTFEKSQCEKDVKHRRGEYNNVLLTDDELSKLNAEYGENRTQKAITYLDEYIEMKGAKYKSHYLALRKWVFNALEEKCNPLNNYNKVKRGENNSLFDNLDEIDLRGGKC